MNEEKLKELYVGHLGEMIERNGIVLKPRVRHIRQYENTPNRKIIGRQTEPTFDPDRTWFCSDHHFGHKNIIQYSDRPYADLDAMREQMIEAHNEVVGHNDVVYFVGDFAFLNVMLANQIMNRMSGYKIHIAGNHDYKKKKLNKYHVDRQSLCELLTVNGITFAITHYHMDNLPKTVFNIHGHTHNVCSLNPQHINVSVEVTNYAPISLTELISTAEERKDFL